MKTVSITFRDTPVTSYLRLFGRDRKPRLTNVGSVTSAGTVSLLWSFTHRLPRQVGHNIKSCTEYRLQQTHKQGFLVSISSYSLKPTGIPSREKTSMPNESFSTMSMYQVCIQEPESNASVFSLALSLRTLMPGPCSLLRQLLWSSFVQFYNATIQQ